MCLCLLKVCYVCTHQHRSDPCTHARAHVPVSYIAKVQEKKEKFGRIIQKSKGAPGHHCKASDERDINKTVQGEIKQE